MNRTQKQRVRRNAARRRLRQALSHPRGRLFMQTWEALTHRIRIEQAVDRMCAPLYLAASVFGESP